MRVDTVSVSGVSRARVVLADGSEVQADHAVLATGGMYLDRRLAGILRPCWSYLVALKDPRPPGAGA